MNKILKDFYDYAIAEIADVGLRMGYREEPWNYGKNREVHKDQMEIRQLGDWNESLISSYSGKFNNDEEKEHIKDILIENLPDNFHGFLEKIFNEAIVISNEIAMEDWGEYNISPIYKRTPEIIKELQQKYNPFNSKISKWKKIFAAAPELIQKMQDQFYDPEQIIVANYVQQRGKSITVNPRNLEYWEKADIVADLMQDRKFVSNLFDEAQNFADSFINEYNLDNAEIIKEKFLEAIEEEINDVRDKYLNDVYNKIYEDALKVGKEISEYFMDNSTIELKNWPIKERLDEIKNLEEGYSSLNDYAHQWGFDEFYTVNNVFILLEQADLDPGWDAWSEGIEEGFWNTINVEKIKDLLGTDTSYLYEPVDPAREAYLGPEQTDENEAKKHRRNIADKWKVQYDKSPGKKLNWATEEDFPKKRWESSNNFKKFANLSPELVELAKEMAQDIVPHPLDYMRAQEEYLGSEYIPEYRSIVVALEKNWSDAIETANESINDAMWHNLHYEINENPYLDEDLKQDIEDNIDYFRDEVWEQTEPILDKLWQETVNEYIQDISSTYDDIIFEAFNRINEDIRDFWGEDNKTISLVVNSLISGEIDALSFLDKLTVYAEQEIDWLENLSPALIDPIKENARKSADKYIEEKIPDLIDYIGETIPNTEIQEMYEPVDPSQEAYLGPDETDENEAKKHRKQIKDKWKIQPNQPLQWATEEEFPKKPWDFKSKVAAPNPFLPRLYHTMIENLKRTANFDWDWEGNVWNKVQVAYEILRDWDDYVEEIKEDSGYQGANFNLSALMRDVFVDIFTPVFESFVYVDDDELQSQFRTMHNEIHLKYPSDPYVINNALYNVYTETEHHKKNQEHPKWSPSAVIDFYRINPPYGDKEFNELKRYEIQDKWKPEGWWKGSKKQSSPFNPIDKHNAYEWMENENHLEYLCEDCAKQYFNYYESGNSYDYEGDWPALFEDSDIEFGYYYSPCDRCGKNRNENWNLFDEEEIRYEVRNGILQRLIDITNELVARNEDENEWLKYYPNQIPQIEKLLEELEKWEKEFPGITQVGDQYGRYDNNYLQRVKDILKDAPRTKEEWDEKVRKPMVDQMNEQERDKKNEEIKEKWKPEGWWKGGSKWKKVSADEIEDEEEEEEEEELIRPWEDIEWELSNNMHFDGRSYLDNFMGYYDWSEEPWNYVTPNGVYNDEEDFIRFVENIKDSYQLQEWADEWARDHFDEFYDSFINSAEYDFNYSGITDEEYSHYESDIDEMVRDAARESAYEWVGDFESRVYEEFENTLSDAEEQVFENFREEKIKQDRRLHPDQQMMDVFDVKEELPYIAPDPPSPWIIDLMRQQSKTKTSSNGDWSEETEILVDHILRDDRILNPAIKTMEKIVKKGGTPQDLTNWIIENILNPYNEQIAQRWEQVSDEQDVEDQKRQLRRTWKQQARKQFPFSLQKQKQYVQEMEQMQFGLLGDPEPENIERYLLKVENIDWQSIYDWVKEDLQYRGKMASSDNEKNIYEQIKESELIQNIFNKLYSDGLSFGNREVKNIIRRETGRQPYEYFEYSPSDRDNWPKPDRFYDENQLSIFREMLNNNKEELKEQALRASKIKFDEIIEPLSKLMTEEVKIDWKRIIQEGAQYYIEGYQAAVKGIYKNQLELARARKNNPENWRQSKWKISSHGQNQMAIGDEVAETTFEGVEVDPDPEPEEKIINGKKWKMVRPKPNKQPAEYARPKGGWGFYSKHKKSDLNDWTDSTKLGIEKIINDLPNQLKIRATIDADSTARDWVNRVLRSGLTLYYSYDNPYYDFNTKTWRDDEGQAIELSPYEKRMIHFHNTEKSRLINKNQTNLGLEQVKNMADVAISEYDKFDQNLYWELGQLILDYFPEIGHIDQKNIQKDIYNIINEKELESIYTDAYYNAWEKAFNEEISKEESINKNSKKGAWEAVLDGELGHDILTTGTWKEVKKQTIKWLKQLKDGYINKKNPHDNKKIDAEAKEQDGHALEDLKLYEEEKRWSFHFDHGKHPYDLIIQPVGYKESKV